MGHLSLQSTAPRLSPPPYEPFPPPGSDPGNNNARALSPTLAGAAVNSDDSSGASVEYRGTGQAARLGFFDGLIGCLRPVWTIIGKATTNELKGQGQYCQFV